MMNVLIFLTLVWVAVLVLALVVYLGSTAFYLRRAKKSIAGIADDLEAVASGTEPLDDLVGEVAQHIGAIHKDMEAVNSGFGAVIKAVSNDRVSH